MSKQEEKDVFVVADSVWNRIVQIVQEGMLMGIDVADLMRQIRLQKSSDDSNTLVLTEAYKERIKKNHQKLLLEAEQLKAKHEKDDKQSSVIVGTGKRSNPWRHH